MHYGFTLPIENQGILAKSKGTFLAKGQSKMITLYLNGKGYNVKVKNVNFDSKFKRKTDVIQIRYSSNGDFAKALRGIFVMSYNYISNARELRSKDDRSIIRLPNDNKEYLAIYTTEKEDLFVLETIESSNTALLKKITEEFSEQEWEDSFNYDFQDDKSTIFSDSRLIKIMKLNKKVGDNLKILYKHKCQICGKLVGVNYGTHIAEAHHIDYFIRSLNNNYNNLLIICPNHHRIIHSVNPVFDRKKLVYKYQNGYEEGLKINKHIIVS